MVATDVFSSGAFVRDARHPTWDLCAWFRNPPRINFGSFPSLRFNFARSCLISHTPQQACGSAVLLILLSGMVGRSVRCVAVLLLAFAGQTLSETKVRICLSAALVRLLAAHNAVCDSTEFLRTKSYVLSASGKQAKDCLKCCVRSWLLNFR